MKKFATLPAIAAALTISATPSLADGHTPYSSYDYVVVVPAALCQNTMDELSRWAYGELQYTVLAVATSRKRITCEDARPTRAFMVTSDDQDAANDAALAQCNANRGKLGRCTIIATVRRKY